MDAWNAGLRPEVDAYLERVPASERPELADALSAFLAWAPTPEYSAAALDAIAAEPLVQEALAASSGGRGLWPALLPPLRRRAALTTRELASRLVDVLGLPSSGASKTQGYLERMEAGELEPAGVSRRVLEGLAGILGVGAGELQAAGDLSVLRPPPAAPAQFRAAPGAADAVREDLEILADALAAAPAGDDWDEVDALFRGGR